MTTKGVIDSITTRTPVTLAVTAAVCMGAFSVGMAYEKISSIEVKQVGIKSTQGNMSKILFELKDIARDNKIRLDYTEARLERLEKGVD